MKAIINTKYIKNIFLFTVLFCSATIVVAQDDEEEGSKFSFSGSIDAYYRANLNAPNGEDAQAPGSSFANLPNASPIFS